MQGHFKDILLCFIATKIGQTNLYCKLKMIMTYEKVKGHRGSNVVKNVLLLWYQNWLGESLNK